MSRAVSFPAVLVAAFAWSSSARAGEPGLEGRADIVLQDSFEDATWYSAWGQKSAPQNTSVIADGSSFSGKSHLRVTVPKGGHYGTSFGFDFAKQGKPEPEELYFRYAIRLGPTWTTDGGGGGKLPGFGGTYGVAGWGGKPSDGTNGWSSRGLFSKPVSNPASGDTRVGFYVYHADMTGQYGSNFHFSGGPLGPDGNLKRSVWTQLELYVKLNTPKQNDGVLKAWADGTQVLEKSDLRFRDVSTLKVERAWFDIYYGGTWTAPADMYLDFDNVVIAYGYVGPYSGTTGSGGASGSGGGGSGGSSGAAGAAGSGMGGTSGATGSGGAPSGGTSGSGASGATGGESSKDGGDDGGCGCRTAPLRERSGAALALALLALAARRRRAR
jgi:hypothetical protein